MRSVDQLLPSIWHRLALFVMEVFYCCQDMINCNSSLPSAENIKFSKVLILGEALTFKKG